MFRFIFRFSFSMRFFFDIFAFIFCLQTLLKMFCYLSIYRLNHVKCLKNWKQWNIYETTLLKFCFFSFYFEEILTSFRENHYFEKNSMLFVCLFYSFISFINRWSIWKKLKICYFNDFDVSSFSLWYDLKKFWTLYVFH